MGWANCGTDGRGRRIGYAVRAKCDHRGCKEKIDRGLAYVCGGMHGGDEHGCGGYFCGKHRKAIPTGSAGPKYVEVCFKCEQAWRKENPEAAKAFDEE